MKPKNQIVLLLASVILLVVGCSEDETVTLDYTSDNAPPPEVLNLTATAEEGKVRLTWENPAETDMVQIQITFSPANELSQPIIVGPDSESYELVNLEPDTDYVFTVRTVDIVVNKSEEVIASVRTIAPEITDPTEFVDERDGRVYKIVRIGDQVWMAENLAYIPEGSAFSHEADGAEDEGQGFKPHYYVAGFNGGTMEDLEANSEAKANYDRYGVIYNWYAAAAVPQTVSDQASLEAHLENDFGKGICPDGWRLPTQEDYDLLLDAIGRDNSNAGEVLKAVTGWDNGGTDAFGFGLLPGGRRGDNDGVVGAVTNVSTYGYWWTSDLTAYTDNSLGLQARITTNYASNENLYRATTYRGSMGASIRAIKITE